MGGRGVTKRQVLLHPPHEITRGKNRGLSYSNFFFGVRKSEFVGINYHKKGEPIGFSGSMGGEGCKNIVNFGDWNSPRPLLSSLDDE